MGAIYYTTNYTYDESSRLWYITLPNAQNVTYQYYPVGDPNAGNLKRIDYPNGTHTAYGYDSRNRLKTLYNGSPGGVISQYRYILDGTGNRTSNPE